MDAKLQLHDVGDVFALVGSIVAHSKLDLRPHQREDLHAYLVSECWLLSLRYQAGKGSTTSFHGWATTNLRLRVIDWQRREFGRTKWQFGNGHTYERTRPQLVEFNDAAINQLDSAFATRTGDPEADRQSDGGWLHDERDRFRVRDERLLGLDPDW